MSEILPSFKGHLKWGNVSFGFVPALTFVVLGPISGLLPGSKSHAQRISNS